MITTRDDIHSHQVIQHEGRLSALDLRRHHQQDGGIPYIIVLHDGDIEEDTAEMLFYEDAGRAGVAWGGDADWFDASSPEQAAQRWVDGSWIDYE